MTAFTPAVRTELAHRSNAGLDVTLLWERSKGNDKALICVCDRCEGAYFEISVDPHLALDVYNHPFFYRDFSTIDYQDARLAA